MTPWRFWFPPSSDNAAAPKAEPVRDAVLWSPQAIVQAQRDFWQQTAHVTEDWWRYWRSLWPSVPVQPPAGVVAPPERADSVRPATAQPDAPIRRHRIGARATGSSATTAKPGVSPAKRARPVARGK
jgi:hypothetical protein